MQSRRDRPGRRGLPPGSAAVTSPRLRYVAVGVTALVLIAGGFAVTKMIAKPAGGVGAECAKRGGDDRQTCYSQLLSERLTKRGLADAVSTLDQLATSYPDVAEHAHEFAHGIGIEA